MNDESGPKEIIVSPRPPKELARLLTVLVAILVIYMGVLALNELKRYRYIGLDVLQRNTISVNGEGKVFAKPDIGEITLSIVREAEKVADAQKAATEDVNKIIAFLKDRGIEEKDIKTTNYSIFPRYDYLEKQGRVFKGYEVQQSLQIKLRDLDRVGEMLAGVGELGASQVGGLNFTTEDPTRLKEEARSGAINDAKEKARNLAQSLGVRLGKIISFSESSGGFPPPIFLGAYEKGGFGGDVPPEIPRGENEIVVSVNITYEIR